MRTRDTKYSDYGLGKDRVKQILAYCQNSPDIEMVKEAVIYSNPSLHELLFKSLVEGKSWLALSKINYVPIDEKDFYGWRRKAIANLDFNLRRNQQNDITKGEFEMLIPKQEQETTISFYRNSNICNVYTSDPTIMTRLDKLANNPAAPEWKLKEVHKSQNGDILGKSYTTNKRLISFRTAIKEN